MWTFGLRVGWLAAHAGVEATAPFFGYPSLVLGTYNHKVGYPNEQRVCYEPTGTLPLPASSARILPNHGPMNRSIAGHALQTAQLGCAT